jgi:predicted Zn-dependent protease with MMP-like domain
VSVLQVPGYLFEGLVRDALDSLPAELAAAMDNVVVQVDDRHPVESDLLGLYDGVPLTERGEGSLLPDVIWIYRLALCEMCRDVDELAQEVRITVLHEVAHHFGIDDERLAELGWD